MHAPPLLPLILFALTYLGVALGRIPGLAAVRDPRRLMLGTIGVTALLSAVLTNDVTCFALTPLLAGALLASGREPLPYLLALACAAPVVLSLAVLYFFMGRRLETGAAGSGTAPSAASDEEEAVPLHRPEAGKAIVLTVAAIVLFLTPVPAPLTALGVAGVVLTSRRMHTRQMLGLVDWHLLALFLGLFIVGRGFEISGWTGAAREALGAAGLDLSHPAVLVIVVSLLGLTVGNVPAVMLLLPFVSREPTTGYALALTSTFAGNAVLVGSIANLIVAEQAGRLGIRIGFREHLGVGLPVTLISLAIAAAAMLLW